eukprot:gene8833-8924_t
MRGVFLSFFSVLMFPLITLYGQTTHTAQFNINGRILSQASTKPITGASIFFNNTTIGDKSDAAGNFTLRNLKPGKYDLIISCVGFETFTKEITIVDRNVILPDLLIIPKTIALNEVKVKPMDDPYRGRYLNWFTDQFLGTSAIAKQCQILNPELLDFIYDFDKKILKASSVDFLIIRNDALGYLIKYQVTDFSFDNSGDSKAQLFYKGVVYENSPMHFLRSALANRITEEGFRVQKNAIYDNPERPADSIIQAQLLPVNYEPTKTLFPALSLFAENMTTKLDSFAAKFPSEKAYLHFDKPYYAAGDTIYFKAY